jgi:hypothetical protein
VNGFEQIHKFIYAPVNIADDDGSLILIHKEILTSRELKLQSLFGQKLNFCGHNPDAVLIFALTMSQGIRKLGQLAVSSHINMVIAQQVEFILRLQTMTFNSEVLTVTVIVTVFLIGPLPSLYNPAQRRRGQGHR